MCFARALAVLASLRCVTPSVMLAPGPRAAEISCWPAAEGAAPAWDEGPWGPQLGERCMRTRILPPGELTRMISEPASAAGVPARPACSPEHYEILLYIKRTFW